ncbi:MAG: secretion protein HlyD, partial [Serratia liquefaciens]|nr:secretion protein HlyD [Serratia liquefaciens]
MNKKRSALIVAVIVLIAAAVYGVWYYQQQQDKPLTLYGNVDIRTVNLGFRVDGRLASLTVDEGDAL